MRLAFELAVKGEGLTRPNPPVGAIVVRDGKVVGKGFHRKAGQPHAEIVALNNAGSLAKGATLYVTLEPCCTYGRTPPCTTAILAAGIKRVVYGCTDPNPVHAGKGGRILQKSGIEVTRFVLRNACEKLIRPFATRMLEKRPYITLKLASTLDGRIADSNGTSKWITGKMARTAVQALRRSADAIMVGASTLRCDNPSLLPRPAFGRQPLRVIIAGRHPLPMQSKVFTDGFAKQTLVFATTGNAQTSKLRRLGVTVIELPSRNKRVSLMTVVKELARRDCMHVVCEGGGILAAELLRKKLVDELWMFYSPRILGGNARPSFSGGGWKLDQSPEYVVEHMEKLGEDVLITARKK